MNDTSQTELRHPNSPSYDLTGKHVVVVGGKTGIGLGMDLAAHAAGARVTVASRRSASVADHPELAPFEQLVLDISDEDAVRVAFNSIGSLDHLLVAAGPTDGSWGSFMDEDMRGVRSYLNSKYLGSRRCRARSARARWHRRTPRRLQPACQSCIRIRRGLAPWFAETGEIGRDHPVAIRELGDQIAEHVARCWKPMKQQQHGSVGRTRFPVKHLDLADLLRSVMHCGHKDPHDAIFFRRCGEQAAALFRYLHDSSNRATVDGQRRAGDDACGRAGEIGDGATDLARFGVAAQ